MAKMKKYPSLEAYFEDLPEDIRKVVQRLRQAIRKAAPEAEEKLSYQMPSFAQNGQLVYYAVWKQHIGFYPASAETFRKFKRELAGYKLAKGTVQFPLDQPLPLDLVANIVKFRVKENLRQKKEKQRA